MLKDIPIILEADPVPALGAEQLVLAQHFNDQTSAHLLLSQAWKDSSPEALQQVGSDLHHPAAVSLWRLYSEQLVTYWVSRARQYREMMLRTGRWDFGSVFEIDEGLLKVLYSGRDASNRRKLTMTFQDELITDQLELFVLRYGEVQEANGYPKIRGKRRSQINHSVISVYTTNLLNGRIANFRMTGIDQTLEGKDPVQIRGNRNFTKRAKAERTAILAHQ